MARAAVCIGCLGASLWTAAAPAGEVALEGGRTLHYSIFNSSMIDPGAAAQHNLVRGANRGMINIAVLDAEGPVPLALRGSVKNLIGQRSALDFVEVSEPGALYYIAGFIFGHEDLLDFDVEVIPQDGAAHQLQLQQKMYLAP
ncbi:MAG: DUF4426 domain-containing protein [Gammaproteobacteria bacterium AqS3]|nr:DUF4426 domain-containing protein [Gammaproteobacteria bacterium AqS3]